MTMTMTTKKIPSSSGFELRHGRAKHGRGKGQNIMQVTAEQKEKITEALQDDDWRVLEVVGAMEHPEELSAWAIALNVVAGTEKGRVAQRCNAALASVSWGATRGSGVSTALGGVW